MSPPGNRGVANRFYHHLMLTQKLISQKRDSNKLLGSPIDNFVRTYLDTLPTDDMSSLVYWDQSTLNKVDS